MKKLLLSVFLLATLSGFSLYKIGKRTLNLNDKARGNRYVQVYISYPATADGNNQPIVSDGTKFPVIAFGHGFVMSASAYDWLANALVANGYILAFPATESGVPPNHSNFGKDELFVARYVKSLGDSINSFLYGKTADYNAIGGHSMGGGASFLGMQNVTDVTTFFNFSAAETFLTESAIAKASVCRQPALIFTGTKDCIAPANTNSKKMYNNLASEYKFFANIIGGSHCQFGDPNETPCELGELVCTDKNYIQRTVQQARVLMLLKPWLDFWLKRDCDAITTFYNNAAANLVNIDTAQNKIISCSALNIVTGIRTGNSIKAQLFPNPSNGLFTMEMEENYQQATLNLFDLTGKIIDSKTINNQQRISLDYSNLPKGMYQLQVNTEKGNYFSKIIIQ